MAVLFAREGADVAVTFRTFRRAGHQGGGGAKAATASSCPATTGSREKCREIVGETVAQFRQLDVLVNLDLPGPRKTSWT